MEFARRQYLVAVAHVRKTLRELLEASEAKNPARLAAAQAAARELLRQGRAVEDTPPP